MQTIYPKDLDTKDLHQYIVGAITPRPIAFVSTIGLDGVANVAPYSFFNAFSSNPPILVFSSNRRVRDNTTKDTLKNVREQGEVVVNVVNHALVRQMALASVEWQEDVSEFDKTGLTPLPSHEVAPYRVAESPIQMECKVQDVITLGEEGGAGHLVICEVVCMHIDPKVIGEKNRIDPVKLDAVGRLGRAYYTRVTQDNIFTLFQPVLPLPLGYDHLPESVKRSTRLTGNDIGHMASIETMPSDDAVQERVENITELKELISTGAPLDAYEDLALAAIAEERYEDALCIYLAYDGHGHA